MDDQYLIVGRAGGRISIVGIQEPTHYSFKGHENDIKAICCSKANPNIFYSGCTEGLCKMWDYRTSNSCGTLAASATNGFAIINIDSDSYDRYIVTTSGGVKFDIWDVRRFSERANLSAVFWQVKFSPQRTGHRYVYYGGNVGRISIFDILTGRIAREFNKSYREVYDCSWHPDENEIVTVSVRSLIE
uniref:WD_REPEATS_REGION domain-containing protein n=1 Tax=Elaeophora elaphi TaxID=1147741 RepID=A0A0R3RY45_9BILA